MCPPGWGRAGGDGAWFRRARAKKSPGTRPGRGERLRLRLRRLERLSHDAGAAALDLLFDFLEGGHGGVAGGGRGEGTVGGAVFDVVHSSPYEIPAWSRKRFCSNRSPPNAAGQLNHRHGRTPSLSGSNRSNSLADGSPNAGSSSKTSKMTQVSTIHIQDSPSRSSFIQSFVRLGVDPILRP